MDKNKLDRELVKKEIEELIYGFDLALRFLDTQPVLYRDIEALRYWIEENLNLFKDKTEDILHAL